MINLKKGTYSYFKFSTKNPEEKADEGLEVLSIYHVYLFEVPMTAIEHKHIVRRFAEEKEKMETRQMVFRKNYDENDFCEFDTLEGIAARSNLWPMIRTHVIRNPEFHQALRTATKQPFYLAR